MLIVLGKNDLICYSNRREREEAVSRGFVVEGGDEAPATSRV